MKHEAEETARPTETVGSEGEANIVIALKATRSEVSILPGKSTPVWAYQGEVLRGDPSVLTSLPDSYLGPTLRVKKGERIRIEFTNDLPEPTVTHWHGLHVPHEMDGHPMNAIDPGQSYTYDFTVTNRAGTYWYHPHPHERTGPQVYRGMAGLFLVEDEEETAAGLPAGAQEIALVLQDRLFDADNELIYLSGGMMDTMHGMLGDHILVNGQPDYSLNVDRGAYRLRLLNGSNARIYKLAWEDGAPLVVIATDGGLLEKAVERSYITLAPGERVELWVDFSAFQAGDEMKLNSLPFNASTMGGMGGMMGGEASSSPLANGDPFTVLRVQVNEREVAHAALPERLSAPAFDASEASTNLANPRLFQLMMNHMQFTINGRTFDMDETAPDEEIPFDTLETWVFENRSGGGMGMMGRMQMAHPMHIHGVHFQVIERQGGIWEDLQSGWVDEGWKDTVLVRPEEKVKILLRFKDFSGLYMYHCHILEHEDLGMMRNLKIL